MVRLHIKPALGHLVLGSITPAHLEELYRVKRATLASRTVAYLHAIIRSALTRAEKQGIIGHSPCRLVELPHSQRPEIKPLTLDEAMHFLAVAGKDRFAVLWTLVLNTGLRQGELLGLRWQDINWERGTLTVGQTLQFIDGRLETGRGKSDKSRRTIPIPAGAAAALREWKVRQTEERLRLRPAWTESGSSSRRRSALRCSRATSRADITACLIQRRSNAEGCTHCDTRPQRFCSRRTNIPR